MLQAAVLATGIATKDSDYGQVAAIGAGAGAALINSKYGRDDERESDVYGMNYMSRAGYNPQGAVELQQTFVALKNGKAANFLEGLFASHPPSQERVATNRQHAATLPNGGIEGRQRYEQMMAQLIDSKPAYEAYDEARQALSDNRLKAARRLVQQAIDSEPREGHFYALLGDIEADEDDLNAADRAYDQAVSLNPNFFYPLMRSGVINERQGRIAKAKRRLNRSLELLETAEAYNTLGAIAEREGNLQQAEDLYARAAQDSGATGQTALTSLVLLRSKSNPAALVSLRWGIGADGKVLIEATNKTTRTLMGIDLQLRLVDAQGILRSYNQRLVGLSPGQVTQVSTGLRPGSGQVQLSIASIETVQGG
jgi:predicted Zn-dependent protease